MAVIILVRVLGMYLLDSAMVYMCYDTVLHHRALSLDNAIVHLVAV